MSSNETKQIQHRKFFRRAGRILLWSLISLLTLLIILIILVQTSGFQEFAKNKAVGWLSKKLNTKVEVARLRIRFPTSVELNGLYIEDRMKDTLVSAGTVRVDLDMWSLFHGEYDADLIRISSLNAKIKRSLPDTLFNFQFIVDAFASEPDTGTTQKSGSQVYHLGMLQLDSIHFLFSDVKTGNRFETNLISAVIRKIYISPDSMDYRAPIVAIDGLYASLRQEQPLAQIVDSIKNETTEATGNPLKIGLTDIQLRNAHWFYHGVDSSLVNSVDLKKLVAGVRHIDLDGQQILLDKLNLDSSDIVVHIAKSKKASEKKPANAADGNSKSWVFSSTDVDLAENRIRFDDDNEPHLKQGMDYMHLGAEQLSLKLSRFFYSSDSITGKIESAKLKEKSGFELRKLQAIFRYDEKGAEINGLLLETPGTRIQQALSAGWPSLEAIKKDPGLLQIGIDLRQTQIHTKDILTFVPDLRNQKMFRNRDERWYIDAHVTGTLKNLNFPLIRVSGLNETYVDISGTGKMITDPEKMNLNLLVRNLKTTRRDLEMLIPDSSLPSNITLPERVSVQGRFNGGLNQMITDLRLQSDLGDIAVAGKLNNIRDSSKAIYDLKLIARKLDLGTLLQQDSLLGHLSADLTVKGRGYEPEAMTASLKGTIHSAEIREYNYQQLNLDGNIENSRFTAKADMSDSNLTFVLDASGSVAEKIALKLNMKVDTLNATALHLTESPLVYKGNIQADFVNVKPDSLDGSLYLVDTYLATDSLVIALDTLQLKAGFNDSGQYAIVTSNLLDANLHGQYKLTQLGQVFQNSLQPYFALNTDTLKQPDPYDFRLEAKLVKHPLLFSLAPKLQRFDSLTLKSAFKTETPPVLQVSLPVIMYDSMQVSELQVNSGSKNDSLMVDISVARLSAGAIQMYQTDVKTVLADNTMNSMITTKDRLGKDRYQFATKISIPEKGLFAFSVAREPLILNYEKWYMNEGNNILFSSKGINIDRFVLTRNAQELSINSYSDSLNAPFDISFNKFELSTLSNLIQQDTSFVNGQITGRALVENLLNQPVFTSDLDVMNLAFSNDTLGNLKLRVSNTVANRYDADVKLTDRGNDVVIGGFYEVVPGGEGRLNLDADIRALQLNTLEGASQRMIRDATGYLNGKLKVAGTVSNPAVSGNLLFKESRFNFGLLNSYFSINDQGIEFVPEGIKLNNFTINDSVGNKATLNGIAYTKNFRKYRFDLDLRADDFKAMNTTKKDNKLYYGRVDFDANLKINGTESAPVVDGTLRINKNTSLTVVLPTAEPGVEQREGIVRFIDMDSLKMDTVIAILPDSMTREELASMDINVNITIEKEAELTLVVDEANGDYLRMKGEGQFSGGIDPGGEMFLSGSYEISEGTYELTFNFIKRKFDISSGSKITWKGKPTEADVDITALYKVETSPLDLVENQLAGLDANQRNIYRQRLPFEVSLFMKGELMQPDITFDIKMPEDEQVTVGKEVTQTVQDKLELIRKEPSELNKQVFALLLLKRFVSESPFQSSAGGTSAESFARTSVSKILTDQLNSLAASLIKGVDVNFDVASIEDYTTGRRQNRTDLNVELSKKLLNDRLTVTVGSNFELEGVQGSNQRTTNIAGNISLNYMLSKDGRYMLRGYRKNVYEGILEGYLIETGLGFIITVDYNRFKQVFMSQKAREKKREERRKARQERKEATAG